MKLRAFLQTLLLVLAGVFAARRVDNWFFAWVGEESEVFVAPSLAALNEYIGRCDAGWGELEPELTRQNRGEAWGMADPAEIVIDEDGRRQTFAEALEELKRCAWFQKSPVAQIATSYN